MHQERSHLHSRHIFTPVMLADYPHVTLATISNNIDMLPAFIMMATSGFFFQFYLSRTVNPSSPHSEMI